MHPRSIHLDVVRLLANRASAAGSGRRPGVPPKRNGYGCETAGAADLRSLGAAMTETDLAARQAPVERGQVMAMIAELDGVPTSVDPERVRRASRDMSAVLSPALARLFKDRLAHAIACRRWTRSRHVLTQPAVATPTARDADPAASSHQDQRANDHGEARFGGGFSLTSGALILGVGCQRSGRALPARVAAAAPASL